MRKLVALVMVLVLCLSMIQVAQAACTHPEFVWQKTGWQGYRSVANGHQMMYEFIKVCTSCGVTNGNAYAPVEGSVIYAHTPSEWYDYHQTNTMYHRFYKLCTVCRATVEEKIVSCPGGDAHVAHP